MVTRVNLIERLGNYPVEMENNYFRLDRKTKLRIVLPLVTLVGLAFTTNHITNSSTVSEYGLSEHQLKETGKLEQMKWCYSEEKKLKKIKINKEEIEKRQGILKCKFPRTARISKNFNDFVDDANEAVKRANLDPFLLGYMAGTESWWVNTRTYEGTIADPNRSEEETSAFGAAQILFDTAKFLGYKGTPEGLKNPKENLYWAAVYIKTVILPVTGYNLEEIPRYYNTGKINGKVKESRIENQIAAEKFLRL